MMHLTKKLPWLAMILLVACQPSDRGSDPDVDADTLPTVTAETHRQQVQVAMRDIRERVDTRQSRISERSGEIWDRVSAQASETWTEIESELAQIGDDDPESIHRSRDDTARRLAELEGELAEAEVETARTPEELRDVSNEWLDQVQSDVRQFEQLLPQAEEGTDVHLDRDDLRDVGDKVQEIRAEVQETLADSEDFEDRRDDISGDLANLVQEVREARYRLQWSHPGAVNP